MYTAFIVGTAGSGKSFLTATLTDYLRLNEINVNTLNMDPGVLRLPYAPDIDVREYIDINELMNEYELGPNGGLVAAVDLIVSQAEGILEEINEGSPDILLIDTPGQMELFAFRPTGVIAAQQFGGKRCVIVNLMDANLSRTPYGLLTSLMLSLNVQMRFFYPQLNIVSKSDLIENEQLEELQDWIEESHKFEDAINTHVIGERREMAIKMLHLIEEMQMLSETFPVSAKTNLNVDTLYGKLQFIWQGGEDFQVEDRVIR
ncbi:MAG: ATP/GTP-binding protein [Candidatus Heimdallarchaeota archaeon]|nr:ATP/GTP-binding protein [Candidatus Heimdallarchaeota archaeon]MBY8994976.1 ATP/GTP-binding protein [Candidatus Heimdallarchaeota archaeon]